MSKAEQFLTALGGTENVEDVEGCITRLRTIVVDPGKVDQDALKTLGAHGVSIAGTAVQVVVGPTADALAEDIQDLL